MLETSMASVVLETSPTNLFQLSLGEFVCVLEERTGKDLRNLLEGCFFSCICHDVNVLWFFLTLNGVVFQLELKLFC